MINKLQKLLRLLNLDRFIKYESLSLLCLSRVGTPLKFGRCAGPLKSYHAAASADALHLLLPAYGFLRQFACRKVLKCNSSVYTLLLPLIIKNLEVVEFRHYT